MWSHAHLSSLCSFEALPLLPSFMACVISEGNESVFND